MLKAIALVYGIAAYLLFLVVFLCMQSISSAIGWCQSRSTPAWKAIS